MTEHGVLALVGRGELPFAPLHGLPLYLHALRSLVEVSSADVVVVVEQADERAVTLAVGRAGLAARVLTAPEWWAGIRAAAGVSLLVHDPLCPLASAAFLASVRAEATAEPGLSVAAYRPVTDTVKTVVAEVIHGTIDREGLAAVVAPVVIASEVVTAAAEADQRPPLGDFAELVAWLRERGRVGLVKGPSLARRVDDASAVNLLECVDELNRQVRHDGPAPA